MINAQELVGDKITELLDDAELTSGVLDKIQRLLKTKWSDDFKTRAAQVILAGTALMTVNHWGIDMPKESWIGGHELPVEQSAEKSKREDDVIAGDPPMPPGVDLASIPVDLKTKYGIKDKKEEINENN